MSEMRTVAPSQMQALRVLATGSVEAGSGKFSGRCITTLHRQGLVAQAGSKWVITDAGRRALAETTGE
jgi:ribosomal protein S19E (S16A)